MENEIKKTLIIDYDVMKYLRIKLTRSVQDPYPENKKTLLGKPKDLTKWSEVPCSWIGRHDIVKRLILSKFLCRFSAISESLQVWFDFVLFFGEN